MAEYVTANDLRKYARTSHVTCKIATVPSGLAHTHTTVSNRVTLLSNITITLAYKVEGNQVYNILVGPLVA